MIALTNVIRIFIVFSQFHRVHQLRAVVDGTDDIVFTVGRRQNIVNVDADTVEALAEAKHALRGILVTIDQVKYADAVATLLSLRLIAND